MRSVNRITGVLTLLVAVVVVGASHDLPLYDKHVPGPGLFPFALALIMAVLALPLLVSQANGSVSLSRAWSPDQRRVAGTLAATALLTFFVPILGFPLTAAIFLSTLTLWWGHYRWWTVILGSVFLSILMLVVFQLWLGLPLPGGLIGFMGS